MLFRSNNFFETTESPKLNIVYFDSLRMGARKNGAREGDTRGEREHLPRGLSLRGADAFFGSCFTFLLAF